MYFCEVKVNILGSHDQSVYRDRFNPVSYPELRLLQAIHGEDAISDVSPFTWVEQSTRDEKHRLGVIYGPIIDNIYPGGNPNMTMDPPGNVKTVPGLDWRNPISGDYEKTKSPQLTVQAKG